MRRRSEYQRPATTPEPEPPDPRDEFVRRPPATKDDSILKEPGDSWGIVPPPEGSSGASGFTGTTCPECGLAQFWCPSGVTCPNGHGFGGPSAKPVADPTVPEQAAPSAPQPALKTIEPGPVASAPMAQPEPAKRAPAPDEEAEVQAVPVQEEVPLSAATEAAVQAAVVGKPVEVQAESPKRTRRAKASTPATVDTGDRSPVVDPIGAEAYRRQQREQVARRLDELVLGPGYERIVEHVFTVDPWTTFEALVKRLQLPVPAHAQTRTLLFDELDAVEELARSAHQLYISAKETVRRFEADAIVLSVDMRSQATAALQAEKDAGQRSKQITDADVESRMATMFPDEWRSLEMRRSRARLMVEHMGKLADAWKERARDVRSMFDGK